jgi:hypothetical protein
MGEPTDKQFTSLCHCFPYILCLQSDQLVKHGNNSREQGIVWWTLYVFQQSRMQKEAEKRRPTLMSMLMKNRKPKELSKCLQFKGHQEYSWKDTMQ